MVVRQVLPSVAVGAVVLPHGAPLASTCAQIGGACAAPDVSDLVYADGLARDAATTRRASGGKYRACADNTQADMPKARLYKPKTMARDPAPRSGRMKSTTPRAMETIPPS